MIPSAVRISQDAAGTSARRQSSQAPLAAGAPCPCCGQAMPKSKKGVSVNANLNQVSRGGQRMRLTGGQFAIFEAIFESYPRVVATDLIYQWAYDTRRSDREPDPIIIKVHVCTLRRRLAPLGLSFVSEYGRGYRLEIGAVPA